MGFISHFLAGGLFNRSEMNKKLDEISDALTPSWKLIDTIDNTVGYSGTWTAPDVFGDGSAYDLGVYMIGGGQAGDLNSYPNKGASQQALGGNSGFGKNVVFTNIIPRSKIPWVIGKGGAAVSKALTYSSSNSATGAASATGTNGGTTSFNGVTVSGGANDGGGQGAPVLYFNVEFPFYASMSEYEISNYRTKQNPKESQNHFDPSMVTLCAGGPATMYGVTKGSTITALPDGTKGGNGRAVTNASANGYAATGYGNGGGAIAALINAVGTYTLKSGAGSDGVIFLYARKAVNTNA